MRHIRVLGASPRTNSPNPCNTGTRVRHMGLDLQIHLQAIRHGTCPGNSSRLSSIAL